MFRGGYTRTGLIASFDPCKSPVLPSLALAPNPPVVTREVTTGPRRGIHPMLARGKSGYDAFPNLSIDDVVIGVKAIDKDGNQSLVSAYEVSQQPPGASGR